jgi:phosphoglycolate phosphatase-like HAD superfamily hydrolase
MNFQKELQNLKPEHEFFIGIDSDGCVFDSMEVKQKEFFIPIALKYFSLYGISKVLRETWEFVNLYSIYRGGNRFISIIKVFELLSERKEIIESGYKLPDLRLLKDWVKTETRLSNANLRKYYESHNNNNKDLEKVVKWSEAVNNDINTWLHNIPPFRNATHSLDKISSFSDIVIVSQTPLDVLEREWKEHSLKGHSMHIAGQEHGTKTQHIAFAAKGKYKDNKILMIGDAKGDLDAAKNNGILFYPVIPGKEDRSWERLLNEALDRFKEGEYAGTYEDELLLEFRKSLPETPPWL